MVDVGSLFEKARSLVDEAVHTSRTKIQIATVTRETATDLTVQETVTNSREAMAIVTVLGQAPDRDVSPTVEARVGDWRVIIKAGETIPDIGQEVKVLECLDPRLIGQWATVLGTVVDSSGAYTAIYARPPARRTGT